MAPQISEDEIDDLIYFARAGEKDDLVALVASLADREKISQAELLAVVKDEGKSTCLHMAAGNGHTGKVYLRLAEIVEIVKLLIEQYSSRPKDDRQAFLDATNEYGNTGLHWAALGGHLDTVKLLVESGASPALANDKNYVPLDLASFNNHTSVVDYFLAKSEALEGDNGDGLNVAVEDVELSSEQDGKDPGGVAPG